MSMEKKWKAGKKGGGDRITQIKTNGWHPISFREWLELGRDFFENEDRIYPPPNSGRLMLLEAIKAVYLGDSEKTVCEDFGLPTEEEEQGLNI